jgi:hypothetical protein
MKAYSLYKKDNPEATKEDFKKIWGDLKKSEKSKLFKTSEKSEQSEQSENQDLATTNNSEQSEQSEQSEYLKFYEEKMKGRNGFSSISDLEQFQKLYRQLFGKGTGIIRNCSSCLKERVNEFLREIKKPVIKNSK